MISQKFSHRHNDDGSFDSICMTCYATVSSKQYIWELGKDEHEHKCNPLMVTAIEPGSQPQLD
jgi:hypothetical protein